MLRDFNGNHDINCRYKSYVSTSCNTCDQFWSFIKHDHQGRKQNRFEIVAFFKELNQASLNSCDG